MEISDGPAASLPKQDPVVLEADTIFAQARNLIHRALVRHYRLEESEASSLEKHVEVWFQRFCQRNPTNSAAKGVPFLLVMACTFARSYQRSKLAGGLLIDSELSQMLDRKPQDVASLLIDRSNRTPKPIGIGSPAEG